MKKSMMLFMTILSTMSFACEQFEAQIIAQVTKVKTDNLTYCKAYISNHSTEIYSEHGICPLTMSEVIAEGITMPLRNGHDCEVQVGDEISGVLITSGSGPIVLE